MILEVLVELVSELAALVVLFSGEKCMAHVQPIYYSDSHREAKKREGPNECDILYASTKTIKSMRFKWPGDGHVGTRHPTWLNQRSTLSLSAIGAGSRK